MLGGTLRCVQLWIINFPVAFSGDLANTFWNQITLRYVTFTCLLPHPLALLPVSYSLTTYFSMTSTPRVFRSRQTDEKNNLKKADGINNPVKKKQVSRSVKPVISTRTYVHHVYAARIKFVRRYGVNGVQVSAIYFLRKKQIAWFRSKTHWFWHRGPSCKLLSVCLIGILFFPKIIRMFRFIT